jgi:hypothetical protein
MLVAQITWDYKDPRFGRIVGPFQNDKHASRWRRLMMQANGKGKNKVHPRIRIDMEYIMDPSQMLSAVLGHAFDKAHDEMWADWTNPRNKTWLDK